MKLVVGPINKGLKTDVLPFNIDNDNFPTLINAYQWRGRLLRKRGTGKLNRLKRFFNSSNTAYGSIATIALNGSGVGNILTGFSLQTNGNIVPGSVTITIGANVYTDDSLGGLVGPHAGSIVYATGVITIAAEAGNNAAAKFNYYPDLPVMGLEDFVLQTTPFPQTIGFDTTYSYNILTASPFNIYDVSFYKNPPASGDLPGYVPKLVPTKTSWNGADYQQFWTTNYEGAMWATNGIPMPFDATNIGMQYKPIIDVTVLSGTTANLQITAHGLVVGDFVFVNEVVTTTGINFQTGYVTTVTDANNVIITFPNAAIATNGTLGIAQYLTNRSDPTKDCLRFYDGDPTDGNVTTPTLNGTHGWVNFAPPLSAAPFLGLEDLRQAQWYLVGARMILPFKDRLVFFGVVVQTSAANSAVYLKDTLVYSQNATPYYTSSFQGDPVDPDDPPGVLEVLVPVNQSALPNTYFEDVAGFGGNITVGIDQDLYTVSSNQDVLICGFETTQVQLVYSGNDIIPFNFYLINSEYGSGSTFSAINMDKGVLTRGSRGFVMTNQRGAERFDNDILDEVFQMSLKNNGAERMCAQRDFQNEWIYFTYPANFSDDVIDIKYPSKTLLYNYRDQSWATFFENYTTYGQFRPLTGFTWATVGNTFSSWAAWNQPWNAGKTTVGQAQVIAGNQQGFVVFKGIAGASESESLYIRSFSGSTVTSPSHGLNDGDFIQIKGAIGTISSEVNDKVFTVTVLTADTFTLIPSIGAGTYFGGATIVRFYVPYIQSRQFPTAWADGRKTRIGVQQYLITKTETSQITLMIFLSQNDSSPYNSGPIVPDLSAENDALVYTNVLYTCPESTNLGLTPANFNLQTPTAFQQGQIWHRINTSLIGDTVQIGFTMTSEQMLATTGTGRLVNQTAEIEIHGFIIDVTPSQMLS